MSQKNPTWQSGFFVARTTDYWLVSQAVMVAVFGVAGSFVEVFAGYAVNRIAGEASRSRVAVCYTILAGGRAFFGVATLDVGVAFFSARATGTGRGQQNAGNSQRAEKLLKKHEARNWEVMRSNDAR